MLDKVIEKYGCPQCGVVRLSGGPHICEHGVSESPEITISTTLIITDVDFFNRLLYGTLPPDD